MYSNFKWQISTIQKLELLLHQLNILHYEQAKSQEIFVILEERKLNLVLHQHNIWS